MGDVSTHSQIAKAILPMLPAAEAPFFEIGNWLTDVSQFRDPFAHVGGKRTFFTRGLNQKALIPRLFNIGDVFLGLDNYLDDVLGVPSETRAIGTRPGPDPATDRPDDGALARWFRELMLIMTCSPELVPPLKDLPPMDKNDIKPVFEKLFTQYFPHEHLDFPPFPPNLPQRGTREPSTVPVGSGGEPRKLLAYLDGHLEYVADLLTRVERDWAHLAASGAGPAGRHELAARFGHASHAVEDYFFHANFVELAWDIAHHGEPALHAPTPPPDPAEVESLGLPFSETTQQRRFHRRMRDPAFEDDGDELSTGDNAPASTLAYTGSFGSNDIFFTLIDALGHTLGSPPPGLEDVNVIDMTQTDLARLLTANPKDGAIFLMHKMFFGNDEERAKALELWQKGIKNRTLVAAFQAAQLRGKVAQFEVDAFKRMAEIEKKVLDDYPVIGLGIVGLLQRILDTGRDTVRRSLKRSREIDQDTDNNRATDDRRPDNGAPGENIGSHSLMCKDSVRKEPLRAQAVNLATFVATYVAKTMTDRAPDRSPPQPDAFVDWAELLRHFVTHPAQAPPAGNEWWRAALSSIDPRPPEGHTVVLKTAAEVGSRADEPHLAPLEQPYYDAAVFAEKEWKKTVDEEMILNSGFTAAVFGGILGMIFGGLSAPDDAGKKALGVVIGLITGGVPAATIAALFASIGLLISRHAGVVVGSYTGILGGVTAGTLLAKVSTSDL
jgi:hypothetical protein